MKDMMRHPFDLGFVDADNELDLIAEELPEPVHRISDCLGTASTFSCASSSSLASFACVASIWSCG